MAYCAICSRVVSSCVSFHFPQSWRDFSIVDIFFLPSIDASKPSSPVGFGFAADFERCRFPVAQVAELFDATPFAASAYEPYSSTLGASFFDSACMVLRPSLATLASMRREALRLPSFDGGDAGFDSSVCSRAPPETYYHWDGPGGPLGDTGLLGWTPIAHHVGSGAEDAP